MTGDQLLSFFRIQIGSPSPDGPGAVTDRMLWEFLRPSLEWLAMDLELNIITDPRAVPLVSGQYEYLLPPDVHQVYWAHWSTVFLMPASTPKWVRDGLDWRNAPSSNPSQYAVENRSLILYPPPATTAVSTDGFITLAYISRETPEGLLTDGDWRCAAHRAALHYLGLHSRPDVPPGPGVQAQAGTGSLVQTNQMMFEQELAQARRRRERPVRTMSKQIRVRTYRRGTAR